MKKLIIEAPSGLDPKYKLWAREAAGEMLSLFPEYKSSFQIEFDELCRHGQTEIDQAAFDRLPDDEFKRKFVRLSNGKYLVPYASEAWYLAQSSAENRANGIDAADMEKYGKLKAEGMLHRKSQDIVVSLLGSDIQPAFYGYGIEGLNAVISTPNCNDKEFFITILCTNSAIFSTLPMNGVPIPKTTRLWVSTAPMTNALWAKAIIMTSPGKGWNANGKTVRLSVTNVLPPCGKNWKICPV